MKKFFLSSLLIVSNLVSFSFAQTKSAPQNKTQTAAVTKPVAAQQALEIPFVTKTLANGLEVIVLQDSAVPIVTVEMAVRNGSFTEPPELNGLSHLYEHMFFKPNQGVIAYQCAQAMSMGGLNDRGKRMCAEPLRLKSQLGDLGYLTDLDKIYYDRNGTTNEEYVNYYFTTMSGNLPTIMRLMHDAMLYPTFDTEEFQEEIKVVLGELDRLMSEPGYALDRTLMDKLFYKYPSRKSRGGTRETVGAATIEQMRMIQSRYYVPNNSALIVTGDADPESVFKLAETLFGKWKRGEDPFVKFPIVDHPPLPKSEGVIINNENVQNVNVIIGWHGPSVGKDNASTYAADVFSYIVQQPGSRLQRALVDSGLATGVDVHYYTQRNVGPIRISLQSSPEKAKQALDVLYKEIAQFNDPNYFTDEELANAKTLLEAEDLFRREKLSEYTHSLGFWWSSTGIDYYRGYYKNLRATSREDIKKYISTYIIGKPHVGVALFSGAEQEKAKITAEDLIGK
ncbi:MAG TPA: pitrilysin family protein [Pyrinomonadaceae bacterium]